MKNFKILTALLILNLLCARPVLAKEEKNTATKTAPAPKVFVKDDEKKSACALCDKIESIKKLKDENEKKAARNFADFLATAELSKDKSQRKTELNSILAASVELIDSDDQQEIPAYLVAFDDEYPEDFKEALKAVPERGRKNIESYMEPTRKMLKNGEPKDDGDDD